MNTLNKVQILGRLGKDPELKYTQRGTAVCSMTIATNKQWKDDADQKQELVEWHKIVVWGKLGELCNQYLSKGRQAFVEGELKTRSWEDKDGKKCYMTEINATNIIFIGSQENAQPKENKEMIDENFKPDVNSAYTTDDIPF